MLPDVVGIRQFVDDFRSAGVTGEALARDLHDIKQALADLSRGQARQAEAVLEKLAERYPASPASAKALVAAQVSSRHFLKARTTVLRARRLSPNDSALRGLDRKITQMTGSVNVVEQMPDMEGSTIDGWKLEKLLGFGGWGQVYLVRQGQRCAALKMMHAELASKKDFVARFKKEIAALSFLSKHPHLIQIDTFDRFGDCWYFLMEYVEGTNLERHLEENGALSLAQARQIFQGVADALHLAHGKGLAHRDIKPANILLRTDGSPVLADFGLARNTDATGATQLDGYTALFASPEQRCGDAADQRSDIYSLAASLYYALMYHEPAKRSPYKFKADLVPDALRDLLKRSLQTDPDERPQHAGEFLRDWPKSAPPPQKPIVKNEPVVVVPAPKPPPVQAPPAKRNAGEIFVLSVPIPDLDQGRKPGELFTLSIPVPD